MRYLGAPNPAFGEDRRKYVAGSGGVATSQTVFNVSYDSGRVDVFLNGVRQFPDSDYTRTTSGVGVSITLASAIGANNVLELIGYQGINAGNNVAEDRFVVGTNSTGSGGSYTGSTTVFPVSSNSGDLVSVWRNGIKLVHTTDFTVNASASTVTLGSASSSADEITVQVVGILNHANVVPNQSTHSGKFLTTDGTSASWAVVDALPSQSGQSGKYLTTNGSASSWATLNLNAVSGALTVTDETIVKIQDGISMMQTSLTGTHEVPSGYSAVVAGPLNVGSNASLTVSGTLVIV
tara:strand:- start:7525 stop:8403 length:879 start_codon:yes stop_codon:yes gene_type:complete